jgi:hypothetical protein
MLKSYFIAGTHSMLIKKDVLKNVAYDLNLDSNQEYDLMIQLSKKTNFDYIKETLAIALESENQISFNFTKKLN